MQIAQNLQPKKSPPLTLWFKAMTKKISVPIFEKFSQFPLSKSTQQALKQLGFVAPTPIQSQILAITLAGQDAIGQAQTGTGKTVAFLVSIIERLLKYPFLQDEARFLAEPRALILAPTRELAQQIFEECRNLCAQNSLYNLCITGGVDMDKQQKQLLRRPLDVLIGTPGRILDWTKKGVLFLDRVEVFVLDEADRMLDMGFIPDIKRVIKKLPDNTHRQSLLFSATFNSDVMHLAYRWLRNPYFVETKTTQKTSDNVAQYFYLVADDAKLSFVRNILAHDSVKKCIIFANQKSKVHRLAQSLQKQYRVATLSGDVVQKKREKHLQAFKDGKVDVLVATDVAGRGIHVDDITHVINYTLPEICDDYIHRIGRTGRAGQKGISLSLVGEEDAFNIPVLQKHLGKTIHLLHVDGDFVMPMLGDSDSLSAKMVVDDINAP